jgi:hypothetical protein
MGTPGVARAGSVPYGSIPIIMVGLGFTGPVGLTAHNTLRGASRATIRRRASVAALAAEAAGLRTAPASGSLWS